MINVVYQDTLNDLRKFREEVERKMKNMVSGFAYEVTLIASSKTPIGNEGDLYAGLGGYGSPAQKNYASFYRARQSNYGISSEVGFHKGAWYYSQQPTRPLDPSIQTGQQAADEVYIDARSQYKIGDSFYILGVGPGFEDLNEGSSLQAPDGIVAPSLQEIMQTYQINLQKYYREG